MNRSKIDQRMNGNLVNHLYLYYGYKITSSKRYDWLLCLIQQTNKISAQTRRLLSNAFEFNMIFRLNFFLFVAIDNHSHLPCIDAILWKMIDKRCIF